MIESILASDPLVWLVSQHLSYQREHLIPVLILSKLVRDVSLERFALPPHMSASCALLVPLELAFAEILQLALLRHLGWYLAQDPLHHGQVLVAGVGVEHHAANGQLEDDAAHTPDIAALVPSHLHHNLGRTIVSGLDNGGVVLVVKCCAAKVNQSDLGILEDSNLAREYCKIIHGSIIKAPLPSFPVVCLPL